MAKTGRLGIICTARLPITACPPCEASGTVDADAERTDATVDRSALRAEEACLSVLRDSSDSK